MSLSYEVGTVSALLGTTALQDRADVVAVSSQLNKTAGEAKAALLRRIAANQHVSICKDDGTIVGYHTFGAASTSAISGPCVELNMLASPETAPVIASGLFHI